MDGFFVCLYLNQLITDVAPSCTRGARITITIANDPPHTGIRVDGVSLSSFLKYKVFHKLLEECSIFEHLFWRGILWKQGERTETEKRQDRIFLTFIEVAACMGICITMFRV
ncbi:MAG: hypothetical protein ACE3JN_10100 [Ectobacillus sp.]